MGYVLARFCALALVTALAPTLLAQNQCTPDPSPCGDVLASFGVTGLTAYSNGKDQGSGTSCACTGKYECVDFVKRFYITEMQSPPLASGLEVLGITGIQQMRMCTARIRMVMI